MPLIRDAYNDTNGNLTRLLSSKIVDVARKSGDTSLTKMWFEQNISETDTVGLARWSLRKYRLTILQ